MKWPCALRRTDMKFVLVNLTVWMAADSPAGRGAQMIGCGTGPSAKTGCSVSCYSVNVTVEAEPKATTGKTKSTAKMNG